MRAGVRAPIRVSCASGFIGQATYKGRFSHTVPARFYRCGCAHVWGMFVLHVWGAQDVTMYILLYVCVVTGGGGGWNAGKWGCGGRAPSCSCAVSAPADQDASQLYYSYRITSVGRGVLGWRGGGRGGGAGERERWGGDPSRHYAVSAPADQDASQLYYSFRIIRGGGGGGEGEPSRSYAVSAPADQDASQLYYSFRITSGGGGGGGGAGERERWEGDPSRSYAVSAPADQDASQQYYSFSITGGRGWGKGEVGGRA